MPLSDAQSDQPLAPFDLSEYIMIEPGAVMPLPLMRGGSVSAPLVQEGMSAPMENAVSVFQSAQNSVAVDVRTSSGGTR